MPSGHTDLLRSITPTLEYGKAAFSSISRILGLGGGFSLVSHRPRCGIQSGTLTFIDRQLGPSKPRSGVGLKIATEPAMGAKCLSTAPVPAIHSSWLKG